MTLTLVLAALLAQPQSGSNARPWSWDVAKTLEDAKAKKALTILLVNVDAASMAAQDRDMSDNPPPEFKSIEGKIANCEALFRFAKSGFVAGVRKGGKFPAPDVSVFYPDNFYVVVLDAEGELLGSMQPEMTERQGVAHIAESLKRMTTWLGDAVKRTESFQELVRQFKKGTKEEYWPSNLFERCREMFDGKKFYGIATAVAADAAISQEGRDIADLYGIYSVVVSNVSGMQIKGEERMSMVAQAQRVILCTPKHRHIGAIARGLVSVVLAFAFDVPGKVADCCKVLSDGAGKSPDSVAVREAVKTIGAELDSWRQKQNQSRSNDFFKPALFGDASATIKRFDNPACLAVAMYKDWVDEARAKLKRP